MEPSTARAGKVRFGLFELDLANGELCKRGRKVPIQGQPFQVLKLLLCRPGEVVTREELQHELWPADTFVEFEHGVNTAIKKLRQALGDSADNPRFIETLPRKGYRFIAPLEGLPTAAPPPAKVVRRRRLWLPAGLGLAAVATGPVLWLLTRPVKPAAGVPLPVPLTSYMGSESAPSFSPDGDRVAFVWDGPKQDNYDIYVKQIGEDQPVRLTTNPAPDNFPAWSPDGRRIAFLRGSGDRLNLFLIPAVGGAERKVADLSLDCNSSKLSWHPGGRWLVVSDRTSAQEPSTLFLVSIETGEKRRLTTPPERSVGDSDPAVSPDGRALVFARSVTDMGRSLCLLALSEDLRPTGEPKRITSSEGCAYGPAWLPGGTSILFSSGASCLSVGLWKMVVRGPPAQIGKPERAPFGGENYGQTLAISPQGRIAYTQSPGTAHIWRLGLGNSQRPENMPLNSTRLDHVPEYSPDSKRIAFASNRSGSDEIWIANADGSNTMKLTSFDGPYVAAPAWSPDGNRIAFDVRSGGIPNIYVVNATGGTPQLLHGSQNKHGTPTWSRDGKWIYFFADRTGNDQVWRIPADGGEAIPVTKHGGTYGVESPDGRFVYYLRSWEEAKSTELWRVPIGGGEEIRIVESVCPQFFSVVERGIYFFSGWQNPSVQLFNFATRKVETVATVKGDMAYGFSVSPDSRWLLYAAYGPSSSDLMLVENFR